MRAQEWVAYLKICAVQIIFLSQAVLRAGTYCKRRGRNRLVRPLVVFKILLIFIVCGGRFAHSEVCVCVQLACLQYGFARSEVCAPAARGLNFSLDS